MTYLERGIIFLSYDPERIIYDDACHLKKCCLNPVQKEVDSSVQEAGEDVYGSGQVTFQESCGSMMQSQLQPPRSRYTEWSKCLRFRLYTDVVFALEWGLGEGEA